MLDSAGFKPFQSFKAFKSWKEQSLCIRNFSAKTQSAYPIASGWSRWSRGAGVLLLSNEKEKIKTARRGRSRQATTPRAARRAARSAQDAARFRTRSL